MILLLELRQWGAAIFTVKYADRDRDNGILVLSISILQKNQTE